MSGVQLYQPTIDTNYIRLYISLYSLFDSLLNWGIPKSSELNQFDSETYGDLGIHHFEKPHFSADVRVAFADVFLSLLLGFLASGYIPYSLHDLVTSLRLDTRHLVMNGHSDRHHLRHLDLARTFPIFGFVYQKLATTTPKITVSQ